MQTIERTRGDDWGIAVEITGVDISTATFAAQARSTPDDETAYDFTCTKDESATPSPRVDCTLPAHITQTIDRGSLYWDLQMTLDGSTTTVASLKIRVNKDVTR